MLRAECAQLPHGFAAMPGRLLACVLSARDDGSGSWCAPCQAPTALHEAANPALPQTLPYRISGGQGKLAARNARGGRQSRFCLRIELVQRQTVMHYQAARSRAFLRIVVATPNLVAQARGAPPASACPAMLIWRHLRRAGIDGS